MSTLSGLDAHLSFLKGRSSQEFHFDWAYPFGGLTGFAQHTNDLMENLIRRILLDKTSWPMATIRGDTIYCLGGEGGSRLWHPATFQIGKVETIYRPN